MSSWPRRYQVMLERYDEDLHQILTLVPDASGFHFVSGALRWMDDFGDKDVTYVIQSYYSCK